jgi:maltose/moltooligosaccharide transporter
MQHAQSSETSLNRGKPQLSFWQIWNMCFGFLGIQFGFALQNANVSRVFQTLGADYNNLAILWIAAPVTGLLVQPIIGYMSDKTWGRFGRRRPYFMVGALLASIALLLMPNSPELWIAAGLLWILDASINVSMEPTRAFVGDMLPRNQRGLGYAMQSFFIGIASVVASALPYMLTNWFGVSNVAEEGMIPDSVKFAFYAGAVLFLFAICWTVFTTKEYSPEELAEFEEAEADTVTSEIAPVTEGSDSTFSFSRDGVIWSLIGIGLATIIYLNIEALDKYLFVLAGVLIFLGLCLLCAGFLQSRQQQKGFLVEVMSDLYRMPTTMRKLAVVQFFSWFPFFAMWTYTTAAVTSHHFGTSDVNSSAFNEGADWVGVLFSTYNATTIFAAMLIPIIARKLDLRYAHMINLVLGGVGFISLILIKDPALLIIPMIGVGFAWASILSVPYAILSNILPANKMGIYMGIFNYFIVLPQILAASILGFLISRLFDNQPIYALVVGGISMLVASAFTLTIKKQGV